MSDTLSKIASQMRKWVLDYIILSIIEKWEVYASDIMHVLKQNNLIIVEWTLYPLLSRLKNEGFIAYYWVESTGWPPRKYFKLTQEWYEVLKIMKIVWKELESAVHNIQQNNFRL